MNFSIADIVNLRKILVRQTYNGLDEAKVGVVLDAKLEKEQSALNQQAAREFVASEQAEKGDNGDIFAAASESDSPAV